MVVIDSLAKVISVINPDRYANNASEVKKLSKTDFWEAVKIVKPKEAYDGFEEHKITYDSSSETLEPVYFWVTDKLKEIVGSTEKLIDTFASSPGSGHFSEMGMKATQMQDQASKIMGNVNTVIKSIVNILYDLKEFKIRLEQYEAANSKNKDEKEAGLLALKQIWMDNVDVKRGRGSINMLAQDLNFVTIRDAFMIANDESLKADGKEMDLNDRVKRILKPRIQEFLKWKELSEKELKNRYKIEKTYLKSQVSSLKLYTKWARPYLRAASLLEQKESKNISLVTAFNTILMELTLLSSNPFNFENAVFNKNLPMSFRDTKLKRNYYSCVLTEFVFTGIPQRVGQHYTFGGRVEVTFRGYSLNEDEIKMLKEKLDESDMNEAMKLVEGTTTESLKILQEDIDKYLKEEDKGEEKKAKGEDTNPFAALFGLASKKEDEEKEKKKKEKITEIKPDNYTEKLVRALTESSAKELCFKVYDIYKKGHGMASHPDTYYDLSVQVPHSKWKGILGI